MDIIEPYSDGDYSKEGIPYAEERKVLEKGTRFPVSNDANIPIIYPNIVHSVSSQRSISSLNSSILLDERKISILNSIDPVKLENSYEHRGDNRLVQAYSSVELINYLNLLEVDYENAREKGYYIGLLSDVYMKAKDSGKLGKPSRRVRVSDEDTDKEDNDDNSDDDLFNRLKYGSSYKSSSSSRKDDSSDEEDDFGIKPKKRGRPKGSKNINKSSSSSKRVTSKRKVDF